MSLYSLRNDTITLKQFVSIDKYGDPSYNDPVVYPCYVEYKAKEITNQDGQTLTSYAYIIINKKIDYRDVITLSDSKERNPVMINIYKKPGGLFHHSEVYL